MLMLAAYVLIPIYLILANSVIIFVVLFIYILPVQIVHSIKFTSDKFPVKLFIFRTNQIIFYRRSFLYTNYERQIAEPYCLYFRFAY